MTLEFQSRYSVSHDSFLLAVLVAVSNDFLLSMCGRKKRSYCVHSYTMNNAKYFEKSHRGRFLLTIDTQIKKLMTTQNQVIPITANDPTCHEICATILDFYLKKIDKNRIHAEKCCYKLM